MRPRPRCSCPAQSLLNRATHAVPRRPQTFMYHDRCLPAASVVLTPLPLATLSDQPSLDYRRQLLGSLQELPPKSDASKESPPAILSRSSPFVPLYNVRKVKRTRSARASNFHKSRTLIRRYPQANAASQFKAIRTTVSGQLRASADRIKALDSSDESIQDSVTAMDKELKGLKSQSTQQQKKLAYLIEGTVRGCLVDHYGKDWVFGRTIASAKDLVDWIGDCMKQTSQWKEYALEMVMQRLLKEKMLIRVARRMISHIEIDQPFKYVESSCLLKSIQQYPPFDEQGAPIASHFGRLIGYCPGYTRGPLAAMKDLIQRPCNISHFAEAPISLMGIMLLCDAMYGDAIGTWPPHRLEFDCQGEITGENLHFKLSGAEIKSTQKGFHEGELQLVRRFKLLFTALRIIFGDEAKFEATGTVYALLTKSVTPIAIEKSIVAQGGDIIIDRRVVESNPLRMLW